MFEFGFEIEVWQWALLALSAFIVGVSKTGIPGLGILPVPLFALVLPAKASVGLLLPLLIFADIFSAGYYRRHAQWGHIARLMPWTLAGIVTGYFAMGKVSDDQLKPVIGIIVLVMLALRYISDMRKNGGGEGNALGKFVFIAALGFTAGLTTMMANAAGPIMVIYLLTAGLPKTEFVGTSAWFFFIVNWVKVPFSAKLALISVESLKLDLTLFPFIVVGAVVGIVLLKRIPQKVFRVLVLVLATAAAVKLIF
ncbi:MAG: sulfite exporter TauE/SafE family protein [Planctomycetes bacterium]|nr:sulfite exporter TauE/SafE family protein [Planctomycetota bacterium]